MTPAVQDIYIKWSMRHEGEDMIAYLSALNNPEQYLIILVNVSMMSYHALLIG